MDDARAVRPNLQKGLKLLKKLKCWDLIIMNG